MAAICQSADMFLGSKNLVLTFLQMSWEEGGLIWENSNYVTAFLIPKVQKRTQKISWKL